MANTILYNSENILIAANDEKQHIMIELSSSGYRPKFVSHYIESREELEQLIDALQKAKSALT